MITGAHAIIYSTDAGADRAFLETLLGGPRVDAGGGWVILRLPPAELAVHPGDEDGVHELYLMTNDVEGLVASLARRGVEVAPVSEQRWGRLTSVTLPGGGKLGVYEPRHESPPAHRKRRATRNTQRASRPKRSRATR